MATLKNNSTQLKDSPKLGKQSLHRNKPKLQTILPQPTSRNNLPHAPLCQQTTSSNLQKGLNTHSTYLKRGKAGSLKPSHATDCWPRKERVKELDQSTLKKLQKRQSKENHTSIDNKAKESKSFMIRKKNVSNYSKKQEESFSKCEVKIKNLHKMVMQEIIANSKDLYEKVYDEKLENASNNTIETEPMKKTGDIKLSAACQMQESMTCQLNPVKIKPVVCKEPRRAASKYLSNEIKTECDGFRQTDSKCLKEQKTDETPQKHLQQMLKKIRTASKSSFETNTAPKIKDLFSQTEKPVKKIVTQKNKAFHDSDKENKSEKSKVYPGCKTIRIPWGQSHGFSFNELLNKELKKEQTTMKGSSHKQVQIQIEEDIFGGISIIPSKRGSGDIVTTAHNIPIESLREIFDELRYRDFHGEQASSNNFLP